MEQGTQWYVVYEPADGNRPVTIASAPPFDPATLPPNLAAHAFAGPMTPEVRWDRATATVVPRVTGKAELDAGDLVRLHAVWWRWKTTRDEAAARSVAATVLSALTTRADAAWTDYLAGLQAWRQAS
jgi:hypothetical protein